MKKHEEGYILAYILVVMAVLTTVALVTSAAVMENYKVQAKEIGAMQKRYEDSAIEDEQKSMGENLNIIAEELKGTGFSVTFNSALTEVANQENAMNEIKTAFNGRSFVSFAKTLDGDWEKTDTEEWFFRVPVSRVNGEKTVTCTIDLFFKTNEDKTVWSVDHLTFANYTVKEDDS